LQDGFEALAKAVDQLRAHGENEWVITVCAEPLFATKWLVPRLHRFYAHVPDAEVRLQASLSSVDSAPGGPVMAGTFRRAGIDLSVRLGFGSYADLHATPLLDLELQPMCAPALLPQLTTPQDILALPLLSDSTHLRSYEHFGWSEWLPLADVKIPATLREQRFGNGLLALEAAITGQGVLLASAALTQAERDAGKLAIAF
jgi:LysR family glycine cleavage system transcriptional activator